MSNTPDFLGRCYVERFDITAKSSRDFAAPRTSTWLAVDKVLSRNLRAIILDSDHERSALVADAAFKSTVLNDPNVISVLQVFTKDNVAIFTEIPLGIQLSRLLNGTPLNPEAVISIVGNISATLTNASRRGIRHLILDAQNFYLTDSGEVLVDGLGVLPVLLGANLQLPSSDLDRQETRGMAVFTAALLLGQNYPNDPQTHDTVISNALALPDLPSRLRELLESELHHGFAPLTLTDFMGKLVPWEKAKVDSLVSHYKSQLSADELANLGENVLPLKSIAIPPLNPNSIGTPEVSSVKNSVTDTFSQEEKTESPASLANRAADTFLTTPSIPVTPTPKIAVTPPSSMTEVPNLFSFSADSMDNNQRADLVADLTESDADISPDLSVDNMESRVKRQSLFGKADDTEAYTTEGSLTANTELVRSLTEKSLNTPFDASFTTTDEESKEEDTENKLSLGTLRTTLSNLLSSEKVTEDDEKDAEFVSALDLFKDDKTDFSVQSLEESVLFPSDLAEKDTQTPARKLNATRIVTIVFAILVIAGLVFGFMKLLKPLAPVELAEHPNAKNKESNETTNEEITVSTTPEIASIEIVTDELDALKADKELWTYINDPLPNLFDQDKTTAWVSFRYQNAQYYDKVPQGLLLKFKELSKVSKLVVHTTSTEGVLKLAKLVDGKPDLTKPLTETTFQNGQTVLELAELENLSEVVLWIEKIPNTGDNLEATIFEIEVS